MEAIVIIALVLLVVLNFFDYVSTDLVISKGRGTEANPITKFFMNILGSYWWIQKVVIVGGAVVGAWINPPSTIGIVALFAIDAMFAYAVVNNYKIAWRQ